MPRLRPLFLAAALALAGCVTRPETTLPPAEAALVDAMAMRLAIAREVAWNKYVDGKPVRDPAREAVVLDAVTAQGGRSGLDAARVRAFFAAQIAASCAQQEKLIHLWRRGDPLPTYAPRPLAKIRVDIDAANAALIAALGRIGAPAPGLRANAGRHLRADGVYDEAARLAVAPLGR